MGKIIDKLKDRFKKKPEEPWRAEIRAEAVAAAREEAKAVLLERFKEEEKAKILNGEKKGFQKGMETLAKGFAGKDGESKSSDKINKMLGRGSIGSEDAVSKILGNTKILKKGKKTRLLEMDGF